MDKEIQLLVVGIYFYIMAKWYKRNRDAVSFIKLLQWRNEKVHNLVA